MNTIIDWWNDLTSYQKKNIQLGLKDLKEGRIMPSEEFWNRLKHR